MFKTHNRSDRKVICDLCGQPFRLFEVTKVTDKRNRHYGLVLCKSDNDPTHPCDIPLVYKEEKLLTAPGIVRPLEIPEYVINDNDDRLPSAPLYGEAKYNALDGYIYLNWSGPRDTGSSRITGYSIVFSDPQESNFFDFVEDTGSEAPNYIDITHASTGSYGYKVAAINTFGQGPYSSVFYYPAEFVPTDYVYLGLSNGNILATSEGVLILLSPDV